MKKRIGLVLILFSIILLVGCSNPQGGFGPSWDVTAKLPLLQGSEETTITIEELVADNSEIVIPVTEGEVIQFEQEEIFGDSDLIDIGGELTSIILPTLSENLPLEPIELNGLIPSFSENLTIAPGTVSTNVPINFSATFTTITLTETAPLIINVTKNAPELTVNNLTLTFKDNGNTVGTPVELNNITEDTTIYQSNWDLNNSSLPGSNFSVDISAEVSGTGTGTIDISFDFPDSVKVETVTGLDTSGLDIDYDLEYPTTLPEFNFESGVKKVCFGSGDLSVNVENISGMTISWNTLQVGSLSDDNGDGIISLSGQLIDLNDPGLRDVTVNVNICDNDGLLDYNINGPLPEISGGFNNTSIDYVVVDLGSINPDNLDNLDTSINKTIEIDFDEQFKNIDISPVVELEFKGLEGMTIDLSALDIKAYDSNGYPVMVDGAPLKIELGQLSGVNPILSLFENEPNFLDLIQHQDTVQIIINGDIGLSGNDVRINSSDKIGLSRFSVEVPFSLTFREDISYSLQPEKIDPLDKDTVDLLQKGIKEARLVIEGLNNNFPLNVSLEAYVASIPGSGLSEEDIKDILYTEENRLDSFALDINQRTLEDRQAFLSTEEAVRLTADDLYFGIKVILPANAEGEIYSVLSGDSLSFESIYATLTAKVRTKY
jgi:hypothetical protein